MAEGIGMKAPVNVKVPARFYVVRVNPEHYKDKDRFFKMAVCHDTDCSKRYLRDDVSRGDINGVASDAMEDGKHWHSGTQFVMKNPVEGEYEDSWEFANDRGPRGRRDDPAIRWNGRSWRRCIFCGQLMKINTHFDEPDTMGKTDDDLDGGSWRWHGPAATFRIYREKEYKDEFEPKPERVVEAKPEPEPSVESNDINESASPEPAGVVEPKRRGRPRKHPVGV